jgi:hypothetical protein
MAVDSRIRQQEQELTTHRARRLDVVHGDSLAGAGGDSWFSTRGASSSSCRTPTPVALLARVRRRGACGYFLTPAGQTEGVAMKPYILDGDHSFVIADETVAASPGIWVYVPRGTAHAWRCNSTDRRLLNVTAPGGFEGLYRQAGESVPDRTRLPARSQPDVGALSSAAARYGIRIVGPPPGA